jgi:hypothetical protein
MRAERSWKGLALGLLVVCSGCNLIGGPEGTYKIDRERTKEGFERYAVQALAQVVGAERANSSELAEKRKELQEEAGALIEQMELELHLERGGQFHAQSRFGEETESATGTWALRGEKLETTTVSKNGKPLSSPKVEALHYENGRLSFQDSEVPFPFLVLSRQG